MQLKQQIPPKPWSKRSGPEVTPGDPDASRSPVKEVGTSSLAAPGGFSETQAFPERHKVGLPIMISLCRSFKTGVRVVHGSGKLCTRQGRALNATQAEFFQTRSAKLPAPGKRGHLLDVPGGYTFLLPKP